MEVLIVRHAPALERDRHRWVNDEARPLSPEGVKRARSAARGLKAFAKAPDRVLTSPLVRARQTARILTDVAGWPRAEEVIELSPGKPPLAVLALLEKDRSKRVALVGHQPDLGILLSACISTDGPLPIDLKKNSVACVSFAGTPQAGGATLEWLATPRLLRGFRR
jgi:phosphohistidine phosphatase